MSRPARMDKWGDRYVLVLAALALFGLLSSCTRQQPTAPPEPPTVTETTPQPASPPTADKEEQQMDWRIASSAFEHEGQIPTEYTCEGSNISPQLHWTDPPAGTVELALICDDPDAPRGTFVHWVIYAIPPDVRQLPENVPPQERLEDPVSAVQGRNDAGKIGYTGPCPPPGPSHRYYFRLYALSGKVDLSPNATKAELLAAMEGKIVAQAELMGRFAR